MPKGRLKGARKWVREDEISMFEARRTLGISYAAVHRYCVKGILEFRQHPITKWRFIKRRSLEKLIKKQESP